ncbi:DUF2844 domain-containing protein [Burkholderia cepacia]|uniref:DUF2844 domain-containing protein n=1 Tax=Burkholderia cepacia TaxID=292 RepID=A0AAP4RRU7_BURCE|nr:MULTISPECIES: DUF2844 domain-containing protein [Burkholderia]EMD9443312.1 DUF2844 domain-containing protein [Burkholderia cepacia]MBY4799140.1 DUF2844 domain-containing protein [Burkholderia cepacia]MCA8333964.1 DUF2844 domain-containing protein [Burkholderia cepacia]MCR5897730.1 hypothetical protein [Burkholderia sp. HAN2018]MDN7916436.1 DUF2844 domain-containing protein [Burkholderia cepacia]
MKLKRLGRAVAHATAATGVLWAVHAHAELGGAPMSPPADDQAASVRALQRAMRSADGMQTSTAAYTVREITLGSGTVIHEYTSAAGSVFGLAWQGPTMPDLASLLGSYFPQYTAGVQAAHKARGWRAPVSVDTSGLVIRTGGHMGAFSGQAWLPAALPAGLAGTDIQ